MNIVRRNCFYMYVPEWKGYTYQNPNAPQLPPNFPAGQAPTDQNTILGAIGGGLNQLGQQIGQNPTVQRIGDELESKWINVKTLPRNSIKTHKNIIFIFRTNFEQLSRSYSKYARPIKPMGTTSVCKWK